ncbi:MAG: hypothetical protein ACRCVI_01130 [Mycoplasmoidaceae bacterium]
MMNKKIKYGLLTSLLAGMTIATVLPIVSCSNSIDEPNSKPELSVFEGDVSEISKLALLFAKIGNPRATDINSPLKQEDYNKVLNAQYTQADQSEIYNQFKTIYKFTDKVSQDVRNFEEVVDKISVSGTYPNDGGNVMLTYKLEINSKFHIPFNLSKTIKIGIASEQLTVIKGSATVLAQLGLAIAKVGNSSASSINGNITQPQLNTIISTTYTKTSQPNVWTNLQNYFKFKDSFTNDVSFDDAVEKVAVTGTYPTTGNVNVTVTVTLKDFYSSSNSLTQLVQVGVRERNIIITRGTSQQQQALGLEIAKSVNPSAVTIQERISPSNFLKIINKVYTPDSAPTVWAKASDYFILREGQAFLTLTDVAESFTLSGNYSDDGPIRVILTLKLRNLYQTNSSLTDEFQIGAVRTALTITKGNQAQIDAVGTSLIKVAIPSALSNNQQIGKSHFDRVVDAVYNLNSNGHVFTALGNYYTFNKPGTTGDNGKVPFADAVDSIHVKGTFVYGTPIADQYVTLTTSLKSGMYTTNQPSELKQTFKIGRNNRTKVTLHTNPDHFERGKGDIGAYWGRIGMNNNTHFNYSTITRDAFNIVLNTTVSAQSTGHGRNAWNSIGNTLSGISFRQPGSNQTIQLSSVISSITAVGSYPHGPNLPVVVTLLLHPKEDDYYIISEIGRNPVILRNEPQVRLVDLQIGVTSFTD